MTFAEKIVRFHRDLRPDWSLPDGIELLYPFDRAQTVEALTAFYHKYFSDRKSRVFLLGINPGRFGAGVTGIAFTDPVRLQTVCGIDNPFPKRQELSSVFIYEVVKAFGGAAAFFGKCYIGSVCPLGFTKEGINCNYYDEASLQKSVEPHIIKHLKEQIRFGCTDGLALCLGRGKNYRYLKELNERQGLFRKVVPLPHPRWIMQYRRPRMDEFVQQYLDAIG